MSITHHICYLVAVSMLTKQENVVEDGFIEVCVDVNY